MNIYGRGVYAQINYWRQIQVINYCIFWLQEKTAEVKKVKKDENGAGEDEEDVEGMIF